MSEYKYYIRKIYQSSPSIVILEVGDKRGRPVFSYRPGQYAMISYRNKQGRLEDKHAFSIASSPTEKNFIRFGIKIEGPFTQGLLGLKEGNELVVAGPYGSFVYEENKYSEVVLLAGGIGITPFFSALKYAADQGLDNKLALIYSAKTSKAAAFYDEIVDLNNQNPNFTALFSFTAEAGMPANKNTVYQRVDAQAIKNFIGNVYGKTFFICGPSSYISSMVANLLSLGVTKDQMEREEFSMIPDQALWPRLRNMSYALSLAAVLFFISFNLINKASATTNINAKKYDAAQVSQINQVAYDRMVALYQTKNKALADLNSQLLAAQNNKAKSVAVVTSPKSNQIAKANPTTTVSAPVYTPPAPVFVPAPAPAPMPVTRVS